MVKNLRKFKKPHHYPLPIPFETQSQTKSSATNALKSLERNKKQFKKNAEIIFNKEG